MNFRVMPELVPLGGFGFGLVVFFPGLGLYRKKLLVGDTKIIPIRSLAMGVAQVQGIAGGPDAFPSPVSSTPCYGFKVEIQREGRNGQWSHARTDQNGIRFCLEDASGRVTVDPCGAEFDMPQHCRRQVPPSMMGSMLGMGSTFDKEPEIPPVGADSAWDLVPEPRSDEDLMLYDGAGAFGNPSFRFTEYSILPGHEYDIRGPAVRIPGPKVNDRNLITKGQNEHTDLISSKAERQLERRLGWQSAMMAWGGLALAGGCVAIVLNTYGLR